MFDGIKNGGVLIGATFRATTKFPMLLLPLMLVWCLYAPLTVFLYFYFDWENATALASFGVLLGFIVAVSTLLSWSCFILLEQIRLIETGEKIRLFSPIIIATQNLFRSLPITLAWAAIWIFITFIELIVRRKDTPNDKPATPENIARILGGDGTFSTSGAFFDALKKGVRMIAFAIFPAIAWESESAPIRRGLSVVRTHKTEFATGFVLTEFAAAIVFLPPAIVFAIAERPEVVVSDGVWYALIVYCGFAWSFSLLLEQLFAAELYLWDMKWRAACRVAEESNAPLPKLSDVSRPSIMDDRADLLRV